MRISHEHRFVFFAMPRTGSTTVRSVLDAYSDIKSVHISETTDDFPFYHHISAPELKKIFQERGWKWSDYKKFCMIRNPYDRVVSLYYHHLEMTRNETKKGIIGIFLRKIKSIVTTSDAFRDYVMHINPQKRLTTSLKAFACDNNGTFLIDDVMMYEKLIEDLLCYFDKLNISMTEDDIPHLNASKKRRGYKAYYDQETKKRVSELYGYEIRRFNYHF